MWKKVLYVGVSVILAIVIYMVGYQSNQNNHIYELVSKNVSSGEYANVGRTLGGCFDTNSIVSENEEKLDLVIYPATTLTSSYQYGDQRYQHFETAYYIYLFKPQFSLWNTEDEKAPNKAGIRFTASDGSSYDYYYLVNEDVNSNCYVSNPNTLEEALLKNKRQHIIYQKQHGLLFTISTFTKTQLNLIKERLNGNAIDAISILDIRGEVVYTTNVQLDFSQAFFTDIESFSTRFDEYVQTVNATSDSKEKKNLEKEFSEFSKEWQDNTFAPWIDEKGYTMRYDNNVLSPSSLIWRTIGMVALFGVVVVILYLLLFHFAAIKRIFSRETYKDYGGRGTYVNGQEIHNKKPSRKAPAEKSKAPVVEAEIVEDEPNETQEEPQQSAETETEEPVTPTEEEEGTNDEN